MACNQDGDSDTCGALCGAMTGAMYGATSVPKHWLHNLECLPLLQTLTACLYETYAARQAGQLAQAL